MASDESVPPKSRSLKLDPSDWQADLLVQPHNAQNLRDVERLQSQHPIHEASLMIVEDRLLCKLAFFFISPTIWFDSRFVCSALPRRIDSSTSFR